MKYLNIVFNVDLSDSLGSPGRLCYGGKRQQLSFPITTSLGTAKGLGRTL